MTRLPDWEQRLSRYIASHKAVVFEYGTMDCVMWGAGAVEAVTGEDLAARYRGSYKTVRGSLGKMQQLGVEDPAGVVSLYLPEKPVGLAQRGDLVLTNDGNIAVVYAGTAFAVGEREDGGDGLRRIPPAEWKKAWAVG